MKRKKTILVRCQQPFDLIYAVDVAGNVMYYRGFTRGIKKWKFNLAFPTGYKVEVYASYNKRPIPIKIKPIRIKYHDTSWIRLPKKDWNKPHKKVTFDPETPQLAYNEVGQRIALGKRFFNMPYFIRPFILAHEIGHNFYHSEEGADIYAIKFYLDNGGNPSEVLYALDEGLTDSGLKDKRLRIAYDKLIRL